MPLPAIGMQLSEPRWLSWERRHGGIPAGIAAWLGDRGSLTRRVVLHCGGVFRVELRCQVWGRPYASERRLLGGSHAAAVVREVELRCDERPWVFARTLIPAATLKGRARRLAHLGTRPLGEVLFADPGARRGVLEVARLLPHHKLFRSAAAAVQPAPPLLWARRALFYVEGRPLLVNEVFLPGLAAKP
jgi:chorismate--pyruvate lyase